MSSYTLAQLSERLNGRIIGNPDIEIKGVASIKDAQSYDISFIANPKYRQFVDKTGAAAVIVGKEINEGRIPLIQVENPYFAFLQVVRLFFPESVSVTGIIHPSAVIGNHVKLGHNVTIGPHVVVEDHAKIGDRTIIKPGVFIGRNSSIGADCIIHPHVTIYDQTILHNHVVIHAGAVIGSDGFGYAFEGGKHHKVPQVGIVEIEEDVEIGSNVSIDRAALGKTLIKKGTKIDNLVQIAHNVVIGEHSIIVSQVGISGSTEVGRGVVIGGQAGLAGHIKVGDQSQVGAQSGVTKSVVAKSKVSGYPARPHQEAVKRDASLQRLPKLFKRVQELESELIAIKSRLEAEANPES